MKQGGYLCAVGAFVEGVKLKRKSETGGSEADMAGHNAYKKSKWNADFNTVETQ